MYVLNVYRIYVKVIKNVFSTLFWGYITHVTLKATWVVFVYNFFLYPTLFCDLTVRIMDRYVWLVSSIVMLSIFDNSPSIVKYHEVYRGLFTVSFIYRVRTRCRCYVSSMFQFQFWFLSNITPQVFFKNLSWGKCAIIVCSNTMEGWYLLSFILL